MNTKHCIRCGSDFTPDPRKGDKQKFCSRECWRLSLFRQVSRTCEHCGKTFSVYQARSKARFCSWECLSAPVIKNCKTCGKTMAFKKSLAPKRDTCSRRCLALLRIAENRAPLDNKRPRTKEERKKISQSLRRYYKWSPARHWNYQGGPWKSRRGGWFKQRELARTRDNDTCQACLITAVQVGKHIPIHHIKPYREFATPEEANDLSNLISLCQSCHMKAEHGKISIIPRRPSLAAHSS